MEPDGIARDALDRFVTSAQTTIEELLRLRPELATELGEHRYDDALEDLSDTGVSELRRLLHESRDALDTIDLDRLSASDAVDAEILINGIDRELLDLELVRQREWNPLVWLPGDALYPLIVRDTQPLPDRLRALAARMSQIPDRLELARRVVEHPSRLHVETAVLVRVEEPLAQLTDLGLGHDAGSVDAARRRGLNLLESRYSESFTILPSRTSATRHAHNAAVDPSWRTTWHVYRARKPSANVSMWRSL